MARTPFPRRETKMSAIPNDLITSSNEHSVRV